jgi:hypothetical protein
MRKVNGRFAAILIRGALLSSALWLFAPAEAVDGTSPMSWRGVNIGMTRTEAASRLRELGFMPQPIRWGGRQQASWEGVLPAFPRTGECPRESGEQCEEVYLSLVRDPAGHETVWGISAYSHLAAPTYVERLLAPAFDRYGGRYVVDWRNGYKFPDGTTQFRLWNAYWYPNGSSDTGQIQISASVFPWQTINPTDPVPPVPDKDARAWGVNVIVSDPRIRDSTERAYEDRDRQLPPPVRY